jgi:hypothetical protein
MVRHFDYSFLHAIVAGRHWNNAFKVTKGKTKRLLTRFSYVKEKYPSTMKIK